MVGDTYPVTYGRMMSRFDIDTAVEPLGAGRYRVRIDEGWWVRSGPNGGYVGAIVLRALEREVGDPARTCRSFTVHYLARPAAGAADVEVVVERTGRSLTSVSARLTQEGRALAIAVAAMSTPRPGPEFCALEMPDVPGPEDAGPSPFRTDGSVPLPALHDRYEYRHAIGPRPFSGGDEALAGGWIRLADPSPVDAAVLVAYADAWVPAMFGRVSGGWGYSTIDLTLHLRALPPAGYDDWCLVRYRSSASTDGFCEEDCEIWTRDGLLLAQTRQLAAVMGKA
jgi:acyl-CoA thioesterase